MRLLVAVAAATSLVGYLVGCIDTGLVECADGRLCPAGTACDVAHQRCVAPDQLTACDGLPEQASCTATGVDSGRCFDGVCLPIGCGNGEVEPEERCDDGNMTSGDGCASDCRSREICGDGFADELRGEECDDGNTRSRDGCTNECRLERPTWQMRLQDEPRARGDAAGAFDELYGTILIVGGRDEDGAVLADTWGLDRNGWSSLLAGTPPARRSTAMTYDSLRRRAVLFGGFTGNAQGALLNDTWEWTGASWQRRTSASVPPARMRSALAFDGTRSILFGGSRQPDKLADTWAWDGNTWTRLLTANAPPAREGHAMAFDPKHARVVLFGGQRPTSANDTWIFDGTNWQELVTIGAPPPPLAWGALAYDARRGVLVLSGATADTQANVLWELDGATWTNKAPDSTPSISGGAVLAYDRVRERIVQVGGKKLGSGEPTGEIWEWDGSSWTARQRPVLPAPRRDCALASDPARGRVVLFAGQGSTIPLGDTWEWDGARWRQVTAQMPPPLRASAAIAFDGAEVLLFGGAGSQLYGDTWRFDGARWQTVATTGPDPRFGATMAYDSKRDRVWLFGGSDGTLHYADLWYWDGLQWTQAVGSGPSARVHARLAYDLARDRLVLFGGIGADDSTLTDTWEWDGTSWTEAAPTVPPEARSGFSLVYDRRRARVQLFGGVVSGFSQWEWDGTEWRQPETAHAPAVQNYGCAAYDDARGEIVAFGGLVGQSLQQQTITGAYRGDREEVCRAGADLDGDAAVGCGDDDCRMVCEPLCWDETCTKTPRCGDGACSTLEAEAGDCCTADCP